MEKTRPNPWEKGLGLIDNRSIRINFKGNKKLSPFIG